MQFSRASLGDCTHIHGDCGLVFPDLVDQIDVLLTDAPYQLYGAVRQVMESRRLDVLADDCWLRDVNHWVWSWWHPLTSCLRTDADAWLFCDATYLGFYVRAAYLTNWPLRGIFSCGGSEFLLSFGPSGFSVEQRDRLRAALALNTYGPKDPDLLAALLAISRPGLVLDPFCGGGSTLVAAQRLGRAAIGIECRADLADKTLEALIAAAGSRDHRPDQ